MVVILLSRVHSSVMFTLRLLTSQVNKGMKTLEQKQTGRWRGEGEGCWFEKWLNGEHWLLFQRTQDQFPVPTWHLTIVFNSSSRASNTLTQVQMQAKTPMHIKYK